MDKRKEVQRQMVVRQIAEVNQLITQLTDAVTVADMLEKGIIVISRQTAARAVRNLEDLEKRYLVGQI